MNEKELCFSLADTLQIRGFGVGTPVFSTSVFGLGTSVSGIRYEEQVLKTCVM